MMREQNPGLARRFNNVVQPVRFEDYSNSELLRIVSGYCRKIEVWIRYAHRCEASSCLHVIQKLRARFCARASQLFIGNVVETLVSDAKARLSARLQEARMRN